MKEGFVHMSKGDALVQYGHIMFHLLSSRIRSRKSIWFWGMLLPVLLMTGCVNVEADTDNASTMEKYVYEYTDAYGVERQLLIDYYDEFTYDTYGYYDATFEREASPDWGINISFSSETNSDYLYFYRCFGKGYEVYKEYVDEYKEMVQAGDYKVVLIYTEDGIVGYSSMGTEFGQGILLQISNERWEELSDTIMEIIASAEYN